MSSTLSGRPQEFVNTKNTQVKTNSPLSIVYTAPQDPEETSPTKAHHKSRPSLKLQCTDLMLTIPAINYHPPTETCASPAPQQTGFSKYLSNNGGTTKSSETAQSTNNSLRTLLFRKKLLDDGQGHDEFLFSPIYNHITTRTYLNYEDEDIYSPEISTPVNVPVNYHRTSQDSGVDVSFSENQTSYYVPPILSMSGAAMHNKFIDKKLATSDC
ncbi:3628_t:CDS:2 [Dentiscutata erythropus]|uniref:3628_t:CDS:1 n=1 Tax=Dentiscutata erythropus TaxID=1348616 RepID=A0A9N9HQE6_9GLOM|nr:3628_t:CDS:2 [Dentiscutata erythropus]